MVLGLAAASDVLVLSCTLTRETRHMVGHEVMEALSPHASGRRPAPAYDDNRIS
jgi:glyoxylate/hydroxypyruvate reductase